MRFGELNFVLKDNVIVTLVDNFVLTNLRLTWHTIGHWWQFNSQLVGLAGLCGKAILVSLRPRILIEQVLRVRDIRAVQKRLHEIDVKR